MRYLPRTKQQTVKVSDQMVNTVEHLAERIRCLPHEFMETKTKLKYRDYWNYLHQVTRTKTPNECLCCSISATWSHFHLVKYSSSVSSLSFAGSQGAGVSFGWHWTNGGVRRPITKSDFWHHTWIFDLKHWYLAIWEWDLGDLGIKSFAKIT